jgi:hypothetical protein
VVPAGEYLDLVGIDAVDEAMCLIDAARPAAGKLALQGLRLADAAEWIAKQAPDELIDAPKDSAVLQLPV